MATALSSFRTPAIFHSGLEHSENFDFSYSYSELPVLRSRNDLKFESSQNGGIPRRPVSHECSIVKNDENSGQVEWNRNNINFNSAVKYENKNFVAHQVVKHNANSCQGIKCEDDFELGKNDGELNGEVGDCGGRSAGDGRRVRRRFELQTSCTNLPPTRRLAPVPPRSPEYPESPRKNGLHSDATPSGRRNVLNIFQKSNYFKDPEKKATSPKGEYITFKRSFESSKKPSEVSENFRKIFDFSNRSTPENGVHQRKSFDSCNSNVRSFENNKNFRNTFDFTEKSTSFLSDKIISSTKSTTKNVNNRKSSDNIELVKEDNSVINNKKENSDKNSGVASAVWRLRNSIFSSLKLPRKVSKMAQQQLTCGGTLGRDGGRTYTMGAGSLSVASKRKSAVELLAESKAFYVKSETVLDRKQELPLGVSSALNSSTGAHYATLSGRHKRGGGEALQSQLRRLLGSTSTQSPGTPHDSRNNVCYPEKRMGREYQEWETPLHPASVARSHYNSGTFSGNSSSGTSGSKGQVKSDPEHSRASTVGLAFPPQSLNRPSSSGDNRIFFPDSFVVPKTSRSDPANVFSNEGTPYTVNVTASPYSSPDGVDQARRMLSIVGAYDGNDDYGIIDPKVDYYAELIEDYSTISPPAEYALTERSNYRYVRSNSHSHTITKASGPDTEHHIVNINSHKSLPDLHKQGEHFTEDGRRLSGASGIGSHYLCESGRYSGAASRPPPDQAVRSSEALSSYSKGTSGRSNRSSVFSSKASDGHSRRSISCHNSAQTGRGSADETYYYNRSGSSYARDSGGSSGHCSAPGLGPPSLRGPPIGAALPVPQQRRDSGSSTQHSSARSHRYASSYYDGYAADGLTDNERQQRLEYRVSAPLQFQDGAAPIMQQSSMIQHQPTTNQQSQSIIQISQPINQQTQAMIQQSQLISQQSMSITQQPVMQQQSQNNMMQQTSQNMIQSQQLLSLNATVSISNVALCGACVVGTGNSNTTGSMQTQQRSRGESLVGIHFQASIPPVQFQDARPYGYNDMGDGFYGRRESGTRESRHIMTHRPASSGYNQSMQSYGREREKDRDEVEGSPPGLGNFKRQRCLRYKQRRPILRSKSDISDRYWRNDPDSCGPQNPSSGTPPSSTTTTDDDSSNNIIQSQLNRFFNQLGLDDAAYNEIILNPLKKPKTPTKSPVTSTEPVKRNSPQSGKDIMILTAQEDVDSGDSLAFSDISVADSNLIVLGNDYTVQGAAPKDPRLYRSCEPPSIVERNARIIKWLCNCRKLQAV